MYKRAPVVLCDWRSLIFLFKIVIKNVTNISKNGTKCPEISDKMK